MQKMATKPPTSYSCEPLLGFTSQADTARFHQPQAEAVSPEKPWFFQRTKPRFDRNGGPAILCESRGAVVHDGPESK